MKKTVFILVAVVLALSLFSCATTSNAKETPSETIKEEPKKEEPKAAETDSKPKPATSIPTITFKGRGMKIEAEEMLLDGISIYEDKDASKGYAVKIQKHGVGKCNVVLSAGTWECLVSEKAFDTAKSELYVNIAGTFYKVYPSNPPLGMWELTTRSPIYLHLEQETVVPVSINADSPFENGNAGMSVDYIQFVKTN